MNRRKDYIALLQPENNAAGFIKEGRARDVIKKLGYLPAARFKGYLWWLGLLN
jgi:hypothetical protein